MKGEIPEKKVTCALGCLPKLRNWRKCEAYLDDLFVEAASRCDPHIVAAQLAALDTFYGIGLWKRKSMAKHLDEYWRRFIQAVEHICEHRNLINERIDRAGILEKGLDQLEIEELRVLKDVHALLAELRDGGNEKVMASKWLHFAYPRLFPITDSIVESVLEEFGVPATYEGVIEWHYQALRDKWTEAIRTYLSGPRSTPVRVLDAVVWLVGQARSSNKEDSTVNRELMLLFKDHDDLRQTLAA